MFDIIRVKCPKCGESVSFQSKAGHCHLLTYNEDHVPTKIAVDITDQIEECPSCGTVVRAHSSIPIYGRIWGEIA